MYDRKSNTISDRIVSLAQPHVRPIVRGKAGKKYEFEQNFHSACVMALVLWIVLVGMPIMSRKT